MVLIVTVMGMAVMLEEGVIMVMKMMMKKK